MSGTIRRSNPDRGFGLIAAADDSDVLLHISCCVEEGVSHKSGEVSSNVTDSPFKRGMVEAPNVTVDTGAKSGGKGEMAVIV